MGSQGTEMEQPRMAQLSPIPCRGTQYLTQTTQGTPWEPQGPSVLPPNVIPSTCYVVLFI